MIFGKNTNDEDMDISFSEDGVVTKTYQNNGWLRVNYYDKNGMSKGYSTTYSNYGGGSTTTYYNEYGGVIGTCTDW